MINHQYQHSCLQSVKLSLLSIYISPRSEAAFTLGINMRPVARCCPHTHSLNALLMGMFSDLDDLSVM